MNTIHSYRFRAFAGPYQTHERWMMENAIADLKRLGRRFILVRETPEHPASLTIFVR